MILDLAATAPRLSGAAAQAAAAAEGAALNAMFALGAEPRRTLRAQLSALLAAGSEAAGRLALHPAGDCVMRLPATVGDYTDFYVGIHHATNIGRLFRPDKPLLPNYKHIPIGYHGRASSIIPSGAPVIRPLGQPKFPEAAAPEFGPSRRLDYELELGIWIGAGNALGSRVRVAEAEAHVAGFCLLNDWSARDLQAWEYQPLGPFLAKSFATTISPWAISPEALVPQAARPDGDPAPLPYL